MNNISLFLALPYAFASPPQGFGALKTTQPKGPVGAKEAEGESGGGTRPRAPS